MSKLKQQIKAERARYLDDPLPTYQNSVRIGPQSSIPQQIQPGSERRELTLSGIIESSNFTSNERRQPELSYDHGNDSQSSDRKFRTRSSDRASLDDVFDNSSRSTESNQTHKSSLPPQHQSYFQPPSNPSSSLQRVQYRMRNAVSSEIDERRRRNQAGKLGPRLAGADQMVSHNNAMASASRKESYEPQVDDDDSNEVASTNESEANGSFRSAATVGSIPPQVSSRAKLDHSQFAKSVVSDLGVEGHQAIAAMSVIDRVTNITEDQLRKLDSETRAQVNYCYHFHSNH